MGFFVWLLLGCCWTVVGLLLDCCWTIAGLLLGCCCVEQEGGQASQEYTGNYGIQTIDGIPKPVYRSFQVCVLQ